MIQSTSDKTNLHAVMGTDNGTRQGWRSRLSCSAARIGLMVGLFVVFMVFVGISRNETGRSNLKSGQSTMHTPEDAEHYENYDWKELPHSVQKAAMRLGYNKNTWNDDAPYPPVFQKDWEELNSMEQNAATVLGYDEESWDLDDVLVVVKATVSPTEGETPEDTFETTQDDSEPVAAVEPAAVVEPPAGNEGTEAPTDEDTPDDTPDWTRDSEDEDDGETYLSESIELVAAPTGAPTEETTAEGTEQETGETSAQ